MNIVKKVVKEPVQLDQISSKTKDSSNNSHLQSKSPKSEQSVNEIHEAHLKNYAANYQKVRKVMMEKIQNEERNNPFYIMDISNVTERIKIWKQLLPRVEIFYACKTNPNEEIIKATM